MPVLLDWIKFIAYVAGEFWWWRDESLFLSFFLSLSLILKWPKGQTTFISEEKKIKMAKRAPIQFNGIIGDIFCLTIKANKMCVQFNFNTEKVYERRILTSPSNMVFIYWIDWSFSKIFPLLFCSFIHLHSVVFIHCIAFIHLQPVIAQFNKGHSLIKTFHPFQPSN